MHPQPEEDARLVRLAAGLNRRTRTWRDIARLMTHPWVRRTFGACQKHYTTLKREGRVRPGGVLLPPRW